jgi:hypothetical protein
MFSATWLLPDAPPNTVRLVANQNAPADALKVDDLADAVTRSVPVGDDGCL